MFQEIRDSLAELYRRDDRPWLVGYSGGKAEPRGSGARRRCRLRRPRNGLRRHPDIPRVWVSNPIEYLSTEELALRGLNN